MMQGAQKRAQTLHTHLCPLSGHGSPTVRLPPRVEPYTSTPSGATAAAAAAAVVNGLVPAAAAAAIAEPLGPVAAVVDMFVTDNS